MTEDFLHYVWRTRNFNFKDLVTTDGLDVQILDFGQWNNNAGPDFLLGRIVIDGTDWAGNIEMHLSASEWNRHGHTTDPVYESVILHVVMEEDIPAYAGNRKIPCIELKNRIDHRLLGQYLRLVANESWVPCASHLPNVPAITQSIWLERMLIERIQIKTTNIYSLLDETHDNWEEVLYRCLASAYGFKINSAAFSRLARVIQLRHLYKHLDSPVQLEALLFGAAGMLNKIFIDDYPIQLQKEFSHLSAKYGLHPIDARAWNWGRLRPANFPTIRIAQFVVLMKNFQGLFRRILEAPDILTLRSYVATDVSSYWSTHSDFDKPARMVSNQMGMQSVDGILINTIVPFLFCYGKRRGDDTFVGHALDLIGALPSEENTITRRWVAMNMPNKNAGQSQGLIHLKREYCDLRRCVVCAIGNQILSSTQKS